MVDLSEFVTALSGILNSSTAPNVPTFTMNGIPVHFDVRSPSLPHVDTIADTENKRVILPVMVQNNGTGSYEAYPDMGFFDLSYTLTFRFPLAVYNDVLAYFGYLAGQVVGKAIYLGPNSGSVICGLGVPQIGQMAYVEAQQFAQLQSETAQIYGETVQISREWMDLTVQFYMSGANGLNEANGFVFANQITDTLTIRFPSGVADVSEVLKKVSPSWASSSLTYEQQGINGNYQKGVVTNSAYGATFTVFVTANDFWKAFITDYRKGLLQKSTNVSLSTSIPVDGADWFVSGSTDVLKKAIIKDVSFSYEYGKPITCTFTLEPKATLGTV